MYKKITELGSQFSDYVGRVKCLPGQEKDIRGFSNEELKSKWKKEFIDYVTMPVVLTSETIKKISNSDCLEEKIEITKNIFGNFGLAVSMLKGSIQFPPFK